MGLLDLYSNAIASIESAGSGGYQAIGPVTKKGNRAYGKHQVMDFNVGPWTRKHLGRELTPEEFLNDPAAQDAVFQGEFGSYVNRYGNPQDAASVWFTGRPLAQGAGARDVLGTTGQGYVDKFNRALGQVSGETVSTKSPSIGGEPVAENGNFWDRLKGKPVIGGLADPDVRARLAIALQGMTLNPNEALMQSLQGGIKDRADAAKQSRTVEWLRGQPGGEQFAAAIEAGLPAQSAYQSYVQSRQPAEAASPNSAIAKLQADLNAGLITQEQYNIGAASIGGGQNITINQPPAAAQGYRNVYNDQGQFVSQEPIPGGPVDVANKQAAIEAGAAAQAEAARLAAASGETEIKSSVVGTAVDDVISRIEKTRDDGTPGKRGFFDLPETGVVGSRLAGLGINQEAVDVKNQLATIQSAVAFDTLQKMREASKTGGALGAVSEKELDLLISARGAIQQSSSPEMLVKNLKEIKRIMTMIENDPVANAFYRGAQGGGAPATGGATTPAAGGDGFTVKKVFE